MPVFTYSKARQNFAAVLDLVMKDGKVLIQRRDGSIFAITQYETTDNPFDVPGIESNITQKDIIDAIQDGRKYV